MLKLSPAAARRLGAAVPAAKRRRKGEPAAVVSEIEELFYAQCQAVGRTPIRQYRFLPPRRWRFDFAWVEYSLALELDGGIHKQGRHNRAGGITADCVKLAAAVIDGWRVLRVTPEQVRKGLAVAWVQQALPREDW